MGLHAILTVIRERGNFRVQEILQRAQKQADEMLAEAGQEAQTIAEQARTSAAMPAAKERARIAHRARLEALRVFGNVRESLIDTALDQTRGRLATIRAESVYPLVLRNLVKEALTELEASLGDMTCAHLEADIHDRALLENILIAMELNPQVDYSLNSWGGIVAKSEDDRVVVINTLEARFERAAPQMRRYLGALFEGELSTTTELRLIVRNAAIG
ncbi:MAG: V-type ATP synthase subunit E [Anaerolineales bacterium]|jgi:V/A-type H+-transporting ATPase subunit E